MKKNLLATTALVAAGALVSTGAIAESKKISLAVGGYMEQWVGFGSADHDINGSVSDIDVHEDGEIHFKGSTTLDNGLTFGVNVQLETQVQGDQIDESYIFVKGDFGEIVLGDENGAAYVMHYGASTNGPGLNSGDHQNWIVGNSFELASTYNFARRDNDSAKIRWMSPRFSGIQLGASYAPEATQDDDGFPTEASNHKAAVPQTATTAAKAGANNEEGVWTVAANYDNKFGDIRLRASAGYQGFGDSNTPGADNMWTAAVGLRLETGGFGLHVSGSRQNDRTANVETRDTIAGSVLYNDGPMGISLGVIYGKDSGATAADDDRQVAVELGGKYKLGPGVEAKGAIYYGDREDATVENTGYAVVGGIKLSF